MSEETQDVKEESSPKEEREDIQIDGYSEETEVVDSAPAEVEEPKEVVQEVEEPPQRVPLTRLKKALTKNKEKDETIAERDQRISDLERQLQSSPQTTNEIVAPVATSNKPKRPTLEGSEYDQVAYETAMEKYEDELGEWQYSNFEKRQNEKATAQKNEERVNSYNQKVEDLYNADQDYQKAVNEILDNEGGKLDYTDTIKDAIGASEDGILLDRYLTINRAEVLPKLEGMSPMQQAMELGRIASELKVSQEVPETKPISKAPEPIEVSQGTNTFYDEDKARKAKDKTFSIT